MQSPAPVLFTKSRMTEECYESLLTALGRLGPCRIEEKKTCVHVMGDKGAFLGVHPRKDGLRLTLAMSRTLEGTRIVKSEQASAKRFHNDIDVKRIEEIDDELTSWLREAYARAMT
jgi:hypothetical protein